MEAQLEKTGGLGQPVGLEAVEKRFGSVQAVNRVSIDIAAGEFLSLLGPSGSGKTTLLMMVAGFETVTAGRITMGGTDMTSVPPNRRNLGMVFQRYALFPHMTVAENINFPLKMRRFPTSEREERVRRALNLVQLSDLGHRMPSQLSGGQQQRIAVARALVFEPPVLLMDEPLGALDKKLREEMQAEIKRIHARTGVTIIYVTHDQEEALTMSDRVGVMHHGEIEQIADPRSLYHDPASTFVANFVGKTNMLKAKVITHRGNRTQVQIEDLPPVWLSFGSDVPNGTAALLATRPEAVSLSATAEPDAIQGVVASTVFEGATQMVHVRLNGASEAALIAQTSNVETWSPGQAVSLTLDTRGSKLFRHESHAQ